ncbi:MAG: hypothetical protein SFU91_12375 [Chloroherpetonaceae bacterium]|nr:hypothetical protein [Chloroherpetonaceae bacterium]
MFSVTQIEGPAFFSMGFASEVVFDVRENGVVIPPAFLPGPYPEVTVVSKPGWISFFQPSPGSLLDTYYDVSFFSLTGTPPYSTDSTFTVVVNVSFDGDDEDITLQFSLKSTRLTASIPKNGNTVTAELRFKINTGITGAVNSQNLFELLEWKGIAEREYGKNTAKPEPTPFLFLSTLRIELESLLNTKEVSRELSNAFKIIESVVYVINGQVIFEGNLTLEFSSQKNLSLTLQFENGIRRKLDRRVRDSEGNILSLQPFNLPPVTANGGREYLQLKPLFENLLSYLVGRSITIPSGLFYNQFGRVEASYSGLVVNLAFNNNDSYFLYHGPNFEPHWAYGCETIEDVLNYLCAILGLTVGFDTDGQFFLKSKVLTTPIAINENLLEVEFAKEYVTKARSIAIEGISVVLDSNNLVVSVDKRLAFGNGGSYPRTVAFFNGDYSSVPNVLYDGGLFGELQHQEFTEEITIKTPFQLKFQVPGHNADIGLQYNRYRECSVNVDNGGLISGIIAYRVDTVPLSLPRIIFEQYLNQERPRISVTLNAKSQSFLFREVYQAGDSEFAANGTNFNLIYARIDDANDEMKIKLIEF